MKNTSNLPNPSNETINPEDATLAKPNEINSTVEDTVKAPAVKIYIEVTNDTYQLAKNNGAKYDKSIGKFYVENEVPNELINLLPKELPIREGDRNLSPSCPICQGNMVTKINRTTGEEFWGCLKYRAIKPCDGTYSYEKGLDQINKSRETKKKILLHFQVMS